MTESANKKLQDALISYIYKIGEEYPYTRLICPKKLKLQKRLIKEAIDSGADIATVMNNSYSIKLETLNENKELLLHHPNKFLIVLSKVIAYNEAQVDESIVLSLYESILTAGADVNFNYDGDTALYILFNSENQVNSSIMEYLINQGARCISSLKEEVFYNFNYKLWSPRFILDKKYKHLTAEVQTELKIPHFIHHIWLTHRDNPREIREQDYQNSLATLEIFKHSTIEWNHIVWTNDKSLIPQTIQKYSGTKIEVRSINNYTHELKFLSLINILIEKHQWGKSTDILRYSIVEHFGGVYADLNFIFHRDISEECYKYNFFIMSSSGTYLENYFFAATASHPIINKSLMLAYRNIVMPPKYISSIANQDDSIVTDIATASTLTWAYYQEANKLNNTDVAYPSLRSWPPSEPRYSSCKENNIHELNEWLDNYDNLEICAVDKSYVVGHDPGFGGHTWLNNQQEDSYQGY
ncbi:glycosyltransferase [Rickettsiales endosymbiont of Trichoplax sp. H2]|uniref:glycosyltransferase n=1 Tax=Rickettsiales endosymbiont of Trichoplax sp. H2 TaxID=2021221 RepID=UPI0012B2A3D6|nr:glycosyltransferase [Rickettsiales endosymbiont of Trichoplax sp. H2]MSO14249.1 hypothetical protein [Rickettsiales endosymbiont of Trichoplax sp. H2]